MKKLDELLSNIAKKINKDSVKVSVNNGIVFHHQQD